MKRLLLFLALLTAGIVALRFSIGAESAVPANAANDPRAEPPPEAPTPRGVPLQQGTSGASVTHTGKFEIPRTRRVPEGDGRVRIERVFVMKAADSKPVGDGLQQLDGVEVLLFDNDRHTATLTAVQAFVELERDANGNPSIGESKDIDLRSAVLASVPGSRLGNLRLELGDARVRVGDLEVVMTTAPTQPVLAVIDGERKITLRGLGAQARLPRDTRGELQRADVEILSAPVLELEGAVVRARGRLQFVENLGTGAVQVTLDDDVVLELQQGDLVLPTGPRAAGPAGAPESGPMVVRGDQFVGWLLRDRAGPGGGDDRQRRQLAWRQLVLTGAPATIDVDGGKLATPRLTALPGPFGEPFLITAHGGESRLEQTELRPGSRQRDLVTGTAQRRIHLARPGQQAGALHRALGFPRWTLRPFDEVQVVIGEGTARLQGGRRTVDASRGVRVLRRDRTDSGIVQGLGDVRVVQRAGTARQHDLVATGNDGFLLHATPLGERLHLGPQPQAGDAPDAAWRRHRFQVVYGEATAQGRGVCVVDQRGERTQIELLAADADAGAELPAQGLRLRRLQRLRALLGAEELLDLAVDGWPLEIVAERGDETITARAPRLVQIGPRALRLLPVPPDAVPGDWPTLAEPDRQPQVRRTAKQRDPRGKPGEAGEEVVEMRGPRIDLHHAGGRDVLVDALADGDQLPTVYASLPPSEGNERTTIACAAERLRLLPFVVAPAARRLHSGGGGGAFAEVLFHALGRPWLLVDGVRDFQLDDARHGHVEGRGHRLIVSQGARAALFVGDPATTTPAEVRRRHDGREVTMRGARVRVFDDEVVRLQALGSFDRGPAVLDPTLTMHEPGANDVLSHVLARCRGDIDVLPEAVEFRGPVAVQGLTPEGAVDPDGIRLDARELRMTRAPSTGTIVHVFGKGVVVDWSRFDAQAAEVEFDLLAQRCLVTDPDDAVLTLPEGWTWRAPRLEIDYATMAVRSYRGRAALQEPRRDETR